MFRFKKIKFIFLLALIFVLRAFVPSYTIQNNKRYNLDNFIYKAKVTQNIDALGSLNKQNIKASTYETELHIARILKLFFLTIYLCKCIFYFEKYKDKRKKIREYLIAYYNGSRFKEVSS